MGYEQHFDKIKKRKQKNQKNFKKKIKKSFPIKKSISSVNLTTLLFLIFGFFSMSLGLLFSNEVEDLVSKINFDLTTPLLASDINGEKSSQTKSEVEENKAPDLKLTVNQAEQKQQHLVNEDISYLKRLQERSDQLDQREEDIKRLEAELHKQEIELQDKLEKIGEMRREISSILENKIKQDTEKVDKLVDVYSGMKPENAARIIEKLDDDLSIEIIRKMKKKDASAVLNVLSPDKARLITEKFVGN